MSNSVLHTQTFHALKETLIRAKKGYAFEKHLVNELAGGYPIDFTPVGVHSLLELSIREYKPEITLILLKYGADVNVRNSDKTVLEFEAVFGTSEQVLKETIKRSNNINYRNPSGNTALGLMCHAYVRNIVPNNERLQAINQMLMAGADPYLDTQWEKVRYNDRFGIRTRQDNLKKHIKMFLELQDNNKDGAPVYEYAI